MITNGVDRRDKAVDRLLVVVWEEMEGACLRELRTGASALTKEQCVLVAKTFADTEVMVLRGHISSLISEALSECKNLSILINNKTYGEDECRFVQPKPGTGVIECTNVLE